ncbi:hypothetical protein MAPG_01056 [Magnaporthiopsis poae ATCC 64411]|uniref:Uncharacterized protein n=1 Tax=Magnaporthiopsis poae (strain ATCC 64411 / 73-15) TaxID=644358 RepID=A0A0C4DMP5_MAGP6|nr:hypothetical protein MAPG_01056 [Magnaporthiopsis poae ATCC 64411]
MHYIRILRPPSFASSRARGGAQLELLLTITTDLGESFLCPCEPVSLEAVLYLHGSADGGIKLPVAEGEKALLRWTAGNRVLKTKVRLPPQVSSASQLSQAIVCVRPLNMDFSVASMTDILSSSQGLIMPLYVALRLNQPEETVALRRLRMPGESAEASPLYVEVEEELGESIARHVWDAGVYVSALLAKTCCSRPPPSDDKSHMSALKGILANKGKLDVLEIGSGVGILGLGFATAVLGNNEFATADGAQRPVSILMTDLPEARDRAVANISRYDATTATRRQRQQRLAEDEAAAAAAAEEEGGGGGIDILQAAPAVDYENLDWEDGRRGLFAPKILARAWDLVMLSDCTYNADMLPALVETLTEIHSAASSPAHKHEATCSGHHHDPRVLLATKPRHDSEKALFDLMAGAGWAIEEHAGFELHVFDAASQTIEVYLFRRPRT